MQISLHKLVIVDLDCPVQLPQRIAALSLPLSKARANADLALPLMLLSPVLLDR